MWVDDVNKIYFHTRKDFIKRYENILYKFIYSPHCGRIFREQKISWKYTKIVIKPKVISCFRNKTQNRRKNKLTLKLVSACKTQGLNMGWNGKWRVGLGESIWISTGNGWERLHIGGDGY